MTARVNWRTWHLAPDQAAAEFFRILREASEAFTVDILGVVVMSNHVHFICRMPPAAIYRSLTHRVVVGQRQRPWPRGHLKATVIGQFMHNVMRRTAASLHKRLELGGHFWEQRYHARRLVDATDVLIALAYDHMNPVEQGMASRPEAYSRSSAAWWSGCGTSPVPLMRLPPPFNATLEQLRDRLRGLQENRQFLRDLGALDAAGTSPGSDKWHETVDALLRDYNLSA